MKKIILVLVTALSIVSTSHAATIKGKIKGLSGTSKVLAVTSKGTATATIGSNGSYTVTLPTGAQQARLLLVKNGELSAVIYGAQCATKKGKFSCTTNSKVAPSFKPGVLPAASYDSATGLVLVTKFKTNDDYAKVVKKQFVSRTLASTGKTLGYKKGGASGLGLLGIIGIRAADTTDVDGDGAPNVADVDDDDDGILDNYDSSPGTTAGSETFTVFSNLKVNMSEAINVNANSSLTTSQIDTTMQNAATLAMQVKSDAVSATQTAELDCGGLTYCSTGGTGKKLEGNTDFPGTAGGANDSDGDGNGTMTRGNTGDFQLRPGAASTAIGSGDTYIQTVTDSSTRTTTTSTSMLNFIFNTTPALKSVQVNSDPETTISYPIAGGSPGTDTNCFQAPSAGTVNVTMTAWRPQRPGIADAGEAAYVDLGNSTIVIDIPNAPCSTGSLGGCSGNGPGTCSVGYSESDVNLQTGAGEGVKDVRGDQNADVSNTFTFTIDLTACLADRSISWNSGEKVYLDLQMKNSTGDNSAVKFCVARS